MHLLASDLVHESNIHLAEGCGLMTEVANDYAPIIVGCGALSALSPYSVLLLHIIISSLSRFRMPGAFSLGCPILPAAFPMVRAGVYKRAEAVPIPPPRTPDTYSVLRTLLL